MKRLMILAAVTLATFGCTAMQELHAQKETSAKAPFWSKYLNTGSQLDAQIQRTVEALNQSPDSAELHNTLGGLLVEKGFPKDAEREFERSIHANRRYHPAWYNLGLVRASRGDETGAHRAFAHTVALKPGHAAALFQLGLLEEKRHHTDRAVSYFAKAYLINPTLLEVDVNPRVLDSKLTSLALLKMYPTGHGRMSTQFQMAPAPAPAAPKQ